MESPDSKREPAARKTYVRPELRRIELRAEEAVLGSCKTLGRSGPVGAHCATPSKCLGKGS
jgi:hypothetical protein